jgi:uncharacterized membrane protein
LALACATVAVIAAAAGTGWVVLAVPARADLKLCNTTPNRIGVALGYRDGGGGWITEGWWNLPGQTCETLYKGPLTSRYWYVHAVDYDGGGEWAGQSFMCTLDKAFTIKNVEDCAKQGYHRTGFLEVDVKDSTDWTIRLTDPSEGGAKPK